MIDPHTGNHCRDLSSKNLNRPFKKIPPTCMLNAVTVCCLFRSIGLMLAYGIVLPYDNFLGNLPMQIQRIVCLYLRCSKQKCFFLEVWPFSDQSKLFRRALVDWQRQALQKRRFCFGHVNTKQVKSSQTSTYFWKVVTCALWKTKT